MALCNALLLVTALICIPTATSFTLPSGNVLQLGTKVDSVSRVFGLRSNAERHKSFNTGLRMKLDVAPQVVAIFKTADEQNEVLAVVNAAIAELNKSDKSMKAVGRAAACTYILAAGRPQQGAISVRFNCAFKKEATSMMPGFIPRFGANQEEQPQGGRGAQVAQVSCQASGSQIRQLFIEIDLGYGRRINVI